MAAARSDDPDVSPESAAAAAGGEIWGTLEELLLACAVSRHGTASWDSVAMEVQSRSASAAAARLTPASCRLRFRLLHRRFAAGADEDGDGGGGGREPDVSSASAAAADSCVKELRRLRVAELRREVERHDVSIGSLESKVERLKEERERSLSGEGTPAMKEEQDTGEGSPEEADGDDRVSGGEVSGRSCKESNSSDLKQPVHDDAAGAADDEGDAAVKEVPPAAREVAVKEEASGESVAGSKEADAEKESSDVQSSASPSRRRRRRRLRMVGDEAASTSVPVPLPAAESEPLLAFLESVRASKSGSVFERRLESQEGGRYRGTIRRHVDLEMIRSKLEPGPTTSGPQGAASCSSSYYASASEFYRDLLLLCANALVFFPRGSPEHAAAARTRALVSRNLPGSLRKDGPGKAAAVVGGGGGSSGEGAKKPKAEGEIAGSLLEKATPIIVCRKRSSIAKAAAAAAEEKVEKAETEEEQEEEDDNLDKKGGAKDKARGLRTNKSRGSVRNAATNQKAGKASESAAAAAEATKRPDKKSGGGGGSGSGGKAAAGGVIKKRNAVDFLKRMKQNSVPSTERVSLLETLKLSAATEQKKSGKGGDNRKEPGGSGSKKATADTSSGGRRSVGRPPKRAAAPPTPPPSKRAKDDRPTRKRGKK